MKLFLGENALVGKLNFQVIGLVVSLTTKLRHIFFTLGSRKLERISESVVTSLRSGSLSIILRRLLLSKSCLKVVNRS